MNSQPPPYKPQPVHASILTRRRYQLIQPYTYQWEKDGVWRKIAVPVGFVCDLGSVPRILWGIISPTEFQGAAVIHDFIYRDTGLLPPGSYWKWCAGKWVALDKHARWTRKQGDRLFVRIMRERRIGKYTRRAAYGIVRFFGRWTWKARMKK